MLVRFKSNYIYLNSDQANQNVLYKIREYFYKNILYRQFKELFKNLRPRIKQLSPNATHKMG